MEKEAVKGMVSRRDPRPAAAVPGPSLDPAALSGWPLDPRERGDFYAGIRAFPSDVAAWRKRMLERAGSETKLFASVPSRVSQEDVRDLLDAGITHLREVARILAAVHGNPDLGNHRDPVDELAYIILARKTREDAYKRCFRLLKKRFPKWEDLLDARQDTVSRLLHSGGLAGKKTASLFGALDRLRKTFGSCTMEPAREWSDERLEAFLCSMPEIQRKSAYCIMVYSFGRKVFPVDTHAGRVLSRIGPYRELGLRLEGLDHKKLQKVLADLVPPELRHSLHVNLVAHGRKLCPAGRPLCESCPLRRLCETGRRSTASRRAGTARPTVIDLFCGGGGLSEGFRRAGYEVLLALDQDPMALRTYRLNHPEVPDSSILCRDIRQVRPGELRRLAGRRKVDVLAGAPPCQGFSHVGHRSKSSRTGYRVTSDERNFLYEHMVTAALELRPRLFLLENVPGMKSARHANLSFLESAARMLEERGSYRTAIWRLNAAAFGVPQSRVRYFLVASRTGHLPSPPIEEYQDTQRSDFDVEALPAVTVDEAIFDLPAREAGTGQAVGLKQCVDPSLDQLSRRYLRKFALLADSPILYNHSVRYHNPRDLELYSLLRPGEDSIHVLERHGRHDLMRYRRDVFDDKYARLRGDCPSKTIVAHLAKDGNGYVHPTQVRSISVREAARLQSFPDDYAFCGSFTHQWVQLGNAVPPVLAEVIARSFLDSLGRSRRK